MSESPTDIFEELEHLFARSPLAHTFVSPHEADKYADDNSSREATFYDRHLAAHRICKKIVHVNHLHRKVARIVDEKLREIQDRRISFQPPTAPGFTSKARRDAKLDPVTVGSPMVNRQSVAQYYSMMTSDFCVHVASSIALHPKRWSTIIKWSRIPDHEVLGGCAPSLQLIPMEKVKERFVPEYLALETFEQLKKIRTRSNDLATWEIKGLTVEDTDAMLGVLTMALSLEEGEFRWKLCSGIPCVPADSNIPKVLRTAQTCDAPEIISLVEDPWIDMEPFAEEGSSSISDSPSSILNYSLRRGGSSIECVREDIYLKVSEPYIEWESETEADRVARAASKARAIEDMSWTPPGANHAASHELIQKV
jgi:hypothetical protein